MCVIWEITLLALVFTETVVPSSHPLSLSLSASTHNISVRLLLKFYFRSACWFNLSCHSFSFTLHLFSSSTL